MAMRSSRHNKYTKYEIELIERIQVLEAMVSNYDQMQYERDLYKRLAEDLSQELNGQQKQSKAA